MRNMICQKWRGGVCSSNIFKALLRNPERPTQIKSFWNKNAKNSRYLFYLRWESQLLPSFSLAPHLLSHAIFQSLHSTEALHFDIPPSNWLTHFHWRLIHCVMPFLMGFVQLGHSIFGHSLFIWITSFLLVGWVHSLHPSSLEDPKGVEFSLFLY